MPLPSHDRRSGVFFVFRSLSAVDDIAHHQEIGGKTHRINHLELMLEPFNDRLAEVFAITQRPDRPSRVTPAPAADHLRPARVA